MSVKSYLHGLVAFSRIAADFQAQLVLLLVYFTVVVPFGLWARLQARTRTKSSSPSNWISRGESGSSLESVRRQF